LDIPPFLADIKEAAMGEIISGYIVPHPPIVIPEVGRGEENKVINTLNAYRRVAREIGA
jgi:aromatic ring-opening dioxygenase LigB subunit